MCAKFLKIGKYPLTLFGNMEETPVFFDVLPNEYFVKEDSKSFTLRKSGSEKNT